MALYNLKTLDDGSFTITKFDNDLNAESSYTVSENACDCPAGVLPSCRHRQMLPRFIECDAADQPMFYNFDTNEFLVQDLSGEDSLESSDETDNQTGLDDSELVANEMRDGLERDELISAALPVTPSDTTTPAEDAADALAFALEPRSGLPTPSSMTDMMITPEAIDEQIEKDFGKPSVHPSMSGPLKRRV